MFFLESSSCALALFRFLTNQQKAVLFGVRGQTTLTFQTTAGCPADLENVPSVGNAPGDRPWPVHFTGGSRLLLANGTDMPTSAYV